MVDENINLSSNDEMDDKDNVLRYIFMLQQHLENLSLIWRGLKYNRDKLTRVSEPYASDGFIFEQVSVLSTVLNPHTFVSNITTDERNNIILDTYGSFLYAMNREPTIDNNKKAMMREGFYNTLLLFLNILRDGAGAQFTLGAQSGITHDVYSSQKQDNIKPIIDIPKAFGFRQNTNNNNNQNNNNNKIENDIQ